MSFQLDQIQDLNYRKTETRNLSEMHNRGEMSPEPCGPKQETMADAKALCPTNPSALSPRTSPKHISAL